MSGSVFPQASADAFLASLSTESVVRDGVREWPAGDGVTRFAVQSLEKRLPDGRVVQELVTAVHESEALQAFSPGLLANVNRLAPLGALVPASAGVPAHFATKTGVFRGDDAAAERIYAPLICMHAGSIHALACRAARSRAV